MPKVKDIISILQDFSPEQYIYDYDNVGLMLGSPDADVTKVLCCLDVTTEVVNEAIEMEAQLIISHHPLIFTPLKELTTTNNLGDKIIKLIKNDISVYSAHTNLDFVSGGINDYVAKLFGLVDISPIDSYISNSEGFGRIGTLINPITANKLGEIVKQKLDDRLVSVIGYTNNVIYKVAVINGSGGGDVSIVDKAIKLGANALITGEVKHHVAIYAKENNFNIIEMQHYTSERIYVFELVKILQNLAIERNVEVEIFASNKEVNPRN